MKECIKVKDMIASSYDAISCRKHRWIVAVDDVDAFVLANKPLHIDNLDNKSEIEFKINDAIAPNATQRLFKTIKPENKKYYSDSCLEFKRIDHWGNTDFTIKVSGFYIKNVSYELKKEKSYGTSLKEIVDFIQNKVLGFYEELVGTNEQ